MTNDEYKKEFWSRDLPTDFELWQKIAAGLVQTLKEKNVDMYYINQAEHFKASLHLVGGANLSAYAELVLKEVAQIDGWIKAEATPGDVKNICKLFNGTVDAYRPSRRLLDFKEKIAGLRNDLRDAQDDLRDLENELDGISDAVDDAEEELKKWIASNPLAKEE